MPTPGAFWPAIASSVSGTATENIAPRSKAGRTNTGREREVYAARVEPAAYPDYDKPGREGRHGRR